MRMSSLAKAHRGKVERQPNQMTFALSGTPTYSTPNFGNLIDFTEAFTSASGFTLYTEGTAGTVSASSGTATIAHTTTSSDIVVETSHSLAIPQMWAQIDISSVSGTPTTGDVISVGLFKDASNFVCASVDRVANTAKVEIRISGSLTSSGSVARTSTAPFKLGFGMVGNSITVWAWDTTNLKWLYLTGADVSATYNFKTTGNLTGWKAGFRLNTTAGTSTVNFQNFQVGRFGAVGMHDIVSVNSEDGTPYVQNGQAMFTATSSDPLGSQYMGAWSLNLSTNVLTQLSVIMFTRNGGVQSELDGQVIRYANGDRRVLASTWSTSGTSLHIIHVLITAGSGDVLSGTWNVSGATQLSLPQYSGGSIPGEYNPCLFYDTKRSQWVMAYSAVNTSTFSSATFRLQAATSTDLTTWTSAFVDSTTGYSGPKLFKGAGDWWIVIGGPTGAAITPRIYNPGFGYVGGFVSIGLTAGSDVIPYCQLIGYGDFVYLLTFNNTKASTGNGSSFGAPQVHVSQRYFQQNFRSPQFQAVDLHNNMVAWHDFEENNTSTQYLDSYAKNDLNLLNSDTTATRSNSPGKRGLDVLWPAPSSNSGAQLPRANTAMDGGTRDFTYGLWVKFTTMPADGSVRFIAGRLGGTSGGQQSWAIMLTATSGAQTFTFTARNAADSASVTISNNGGSPLVAGVWYFVVLAYDYVLNLLSGYVNGVLQSTAISGSVYQSTTANFSLYQGRLSDTTNYNNALIAQAEHDSSFMVSRVVTQQEVNYLYATSYGKNFALLASDAGVDPYYRYVVLHLHCDGTNGSTSFVDSSLANKTITASGNAQMINTRGRFGPSALLCDGAGDWIQTTTTLSDFAFGTSAFTVECWLQNSSSNGPCLIDMFDTTNATSWQLILETSGEVSWVSSTGSASTRIATTSGATLNDGRWHHVAVSRTGTTLRLFVDGAQLASATDSRSYTATTTQLAIGAQVYVRNTAFDLNGVIDEIRITNGVGRYTAAFTAPAVPFPDRKFKWSQVSTWLNFNGTNGATTFVDHSPVPKTYTLTNGPGASLDTSLSFSGASSLAVSSSGVAYFSCPDHADFQFGSGDFTIECRIYVTSLPSSGTYRGICGRRSTSSNESYILCLNGDYGGATVFEISTSTGPATNTIGGPIPKTNQWVHIAVTRVGGWIRVFVDGVGGAPAYIGTTAIYTGSFPFQIGQLSLGALGNSFGGNIDNLRVIKGTGLYFENFNPPAILS